RWGRTLWGPVVLPKLYDGHNRTFWTFGFEGLHILRNLGFTATVPTLAERRGDFSELLALGPQYQIYDPATIQPAANGRFSRQPIARNIIPASRIDPVATKILAFWPEPNLPGTIAGRNNYFRTQDIDRNNKTWIGRIDHSFSERHRIFGRVNSNNYSNSVQRIPNISDGDLTVQDGYGFAFDDVYVFGPRLLMNVRYGLTYQNPSVSRFSQGF